MSKEGSKLRIVKFNIVLLAKWKWRLGLEHQGLWKEVLQSKYSFGGFWIRGKGKRGINLGERLEECVWRTSRRNYFDRKVRWNR